MLAGDRSDPGVDEPCDFKVAGDFMRWRTGGTVVSIDGRDFKVRDDRGVEHTVRKVRRPKAPPSARSSRAEDQRRALRDAGLHAPPRPEVMPDLPTPRIVPPVTVAARALGTRHPTPKLPTVRTSIEGLHQRAPWRSPEYLAFVREHPCCVCQREAPSDPHHFDRDRGVATKTDDTMTVPLCRIDHDAFHRTGIAPGCASRLATEALFYRVQARLLTAWIKRGEAPL